MIAKERWLPVVGYEGLYEVSNHGQVRSLDRWVTYSNGAKHFHKGKLIKPCFHTYGYPMLHLSKNGKTRPRCIHKLVAEAFLGPCPKGQIVLHGPTGRTCAALSNLSYGPPEKNSREDRERDGTAIKGEDHKSAKLTEAEVLQIRDLYEKGGTQVALAKQFNIHQTHVSLLVRRKAWAHV